MLCDKPFLVLTLNWPVRCSHGWPIRASLLSPWFLQPLLPPFKYSIGCFPPSALNCCLNEVTLTQHKKEILKRRTAVWELGGGRSNHWCNTKGDFHSLPGLFKRDQRLLKPAWLCQWYALCSPKDDCIWICICIKLAFIFYCQLKIVNRYKKELNVSIIIPPIQTVERWKLQKKTKGKLGKMFVTSILQVFFLFVL